MKIDQLKINITVHGTIFPEPVQVIMAVQMGDSVKLIGKGSKSGKVYEPILNAEQLEKLEASPEKEIETISRHMEISLNELINRQNLRHSELQAAADRGAGSPLDAANLKTTEDRIFELNGRLERRRDELAQERDCTIGDIKRHGRAWVLPHPDRAAPSIAPMVRDDKIERIAVQKAIEYEQARGWTVHSVEKENRGFDLISHRTSAEDPLIASEIRFIEVKGRAGVGEVALTSNEYKTAERLRSDYWLYVVYDCGNKPAIHTIKDPIRLGWEPLVRIEHYHVKAEKILRSEAEQ